MSGYLNDSQGEIIRQLLIEEGIGTLPTSKQEWPISFSNMPDGPDPDGEALCVYNTQGRLQGRTHVDGQTQEKFGIQVKSRAKIPQRGYQRIRLVKQAFDSVLRRIVVVNGSTYLVQAITLTSSILDVGYDTPSTKRREYTLNAITSITLQTAVDTGTGS